LSLYCSDGHWDVGDGQSWGDWSSPVYCPSKNSSFNKKKHFFLARELACLLEKGIWLMGSLAYWDQIWSGPE